MSAAAGERGERTKEHAAEPKAGASTGLVPSPTSDRKDSLEIDRFESRCLSYSGDQMTGHGFRSMASTLLNEQGWSRDAIERQLAHGERNKVRAAYNYAEHLPERRKMMQAWAD